MPKTTLGASESPTSSRRRRMRKTGLLVLVVLALIGTWSTYRFFFGAPGVGHFRSALGTAEYSGHYDDAIARLPSPDTTHDIPTDHGTVRVYEWEGEGLPVVLFPGRASGTPMWSENLPGFIESRRVLAFDLIGDAGMSTQTAPLNSFDDQAVWIDQVLTELAPDGAHVVGHSFGGAVAAAYASAYPEKAQSLALLEPAFTIAYPPPSMLFWSVVVSLPWLPGGLRDTAMEHVGGAEPGEMDGQDDPVALMIAAGTEHYSSSLPTPSPLSDEQAARLTMPVYIALADRDSLAGSEKQAKDLLPDASLTTWPDTTHSLPMQVPEDLNVVLQQFWTRAS